ncbi:MAG: hypothetical protein ACAI35_22790 [Candidatus Methylacidiphilales bacterium]|nr:hypothetical protein [Candidatus Methylacidiphilales bacterium]
MTLPRTLRPGLLIRGFFSSSCIWLMLSAFLMMMSMLALPLNARAGGGRCVLSQDGSTLYLNVVGSGPDGKPEFWAVELPSCKHKALEMSWMGPERDIVSLAGYKEGRILIAKEKALYAFDPSKGIAHKFVVPKDSTISEVAYDAQNDVIVLATGETAWVLPKGEDVFSELNVRRVRWLEGMAFAGNGNLLFSNNGDIWHGKIESDTDEENGKKVTRYSLLGYRYAPLATLETANATPAQEGARCLAFFGDSVYAEINRLGGSGWGTLVRLAPPELGKPRGPDQVLETYQSVAERLAVAKKALAGTTVLGGSGGRFFLSVSGDGSTLFYLIERETGDDLDEFYVLKKGGKPERVKLKLPEPG